MRTFKIERIRDVALTPRHASSRRRTPRSTACSSGPGTSSRTRSRSTSSCASRPRSRAASARRAGTRPSGSTEEPDGSLTWRATVAGPIEIRLWILSWGDDVEVLAPAALRDDVAATHAGPRRATAERPARPQAPG